MRVYPDKLHDHLARQLAPAYLVSGDEPLQLGECCDAIRAAARSAGHTSREVLEAGSGFDWHQLTAEASAYSLFADRKTIDVRIPGGKPGAEGSKALIAYCTDPPPDTLLLISMPKLDRQQQNSKWFKALDALGVVVQVWPIDTQRLPAWIGQRLQSAGIQPTGEVVQMLAERVEGNLLAARQEVEKLLLLHGPGALDADQLEAAVGDSARFDVFELVDSALRGEVERSVRILDGLRAEGLAPAVVLWALHREVRNMAQMSADIAKGLSPDQAIGKSRVFSKRVSVVRQGLARLRAAQWLAALDRCHEADAAIKGIGGRQPWLLLEDIVLGINGKSVFLRRTVSA
jgi:DNA polymerase-3 subunit delta